MVRLVLLPLLLLLAGCSSTEAGGGSEPGCFTSYDAAYEPATPSPDASASAC